MVLPVPYSNEQHVHFKEDGATVAADGATVAADGATVAADGATVAPDGAASDVQCKAWLHCVLP